MLFLLCVVMFFLVHKSGKLLYSTTPRLAVDKNIWKPPSHTTVCVKQVMWYNLWNDLFVKFCVILWLTTEKIPYLLTFPQIKYTSEISDIPEMKLPWPIVSWQLRHLLSLRPSYYLKTLNVGQLCSYWPQKGQNNSVFCPVVSYIRKIAKLWCAQWTIKHNWYCWKHAGQKVCFCFMSMSSVTAKCMSKHVKIIKNVCQNVQYAELLRLKKKSTFSS